MSADVSALLARLEAKRVMVSVTPSGLHVKAPPGAFTEDLRQTLKEQKQAVIEALKAKAPGAREGAAPEVSRRLAEDGWAIVRSETLGGELVIWTRDESVEVPERFAQLVRYTRDELAALVGATEEHLRAIHKAKRELPGFSVTEFRSLRGEEEA